MNIVALSTTYIFSLAERDQKKTYQIQNVTLKDVVDSSPYSPLECRTP